MHSWLIPHVYDSRSIKISKEHIIIMIQLFKGLKLFDNMMIISCVSKLLVWVLIFLFSQHHHHHYHLFSCSSSIWSIFGGGMEGDREEGILDHSWFPWIEQKSNALGVVSFTQWWVRKSSSSNENKDLIDRALIGFRVRVPHLWKDFERR